MPPSVAAPLFTGPVGRTLQRHRSAVRQLLTNRGYRHPAVFGSVARGTDTIASDVDLLVDLPDGASLTELSRAAIDLEQLLGIPVDLVPRASLRPRTAESILAEAISL